MTRTLTRNRSLAAGRIFLTSAVIVAMAWTPALAAKTKTTVKSATSSYQAAVDGAYSKFKDLKEGKNADYIPALAEVDPNIFGIALVTVDGKMYTAGDLDSKVSIQSISK